MAQNQVRSATVSFAAALAERRAEQCRAWNARRAHQVAAGKARAAQMTPEERTKGGYHSSAKQGAQWRAQQGLPPRRVSDALWLTPEDVRTITGETLAPETKRRILRAWRAGVLLAVGYWLRFPSWADELDQRLDAEERGVMQPELLPMPDDFLDLPDSQIPQRSETYLGLKERGEVHRQH